MENEIEKKSIKNDPKNKQAQLDSTCQIYNRGHKIKIIPLKTNKNNYKAQFSTNLMLNDEIEKK